MKTDGELLDRISRKKTVCTASQESGGKTARYNRFAVRSSSAATRLTV